MELRSLPLRALGPVLMAAMALTLIFSFAGPADAATREEVEGAMLAASKKDGGFNKAADHFRAMARFSDSPFKFDGNITVLLPSNFYWGRYRLDIVPANELAGLINLHTLRGRLRARQLRRLDPFTILATSDKIQQLQVAEAPSGKGRTGKREVHLEVPEAHHGPRNPKETKCKIVRPDLFVGPSIVVHGMDCVLTPFYYPKGPYTTVSA